LRRAETPTSIVGPLVEKGLYDELSGETYAIIDGVDGRVHHMRFDGLRALEHAAPEGGIVEVRRFGRPNERMAIETIRKAKRSP
jgi:type IV secretory pathway VirD2 relaxase